MLTSLCNMYGQPQPANIRGGRIQDFLRERAKPTIASRFLKQGFWGAQPPRSYRQAPAYYAQILPIMLLSSAQKCYPLCSILCPYITAVMPQFIYNFIILNDCISIFMLQHVLYYVMLQLLLYFTYYAHNKICTSFCITWT